LYLGTPREPVPFGGRDKALRALDAWLEDPQFIGQTPPPGGCGCSIGCSDAAVNWIAPTGISF